MGRAQDQDREGDVVTVVGCGLMGAAIARCLARSGHRVLAWNRTHERAEALAGDGIIPVRDLREAVRDAPLVIACTTSYETTLAALEPVADWAATSLVNLTSGDPGQARAMERWANERGGAYLHGFVVAYPRQIGLPETMLTYSGSPAVWSRYERTLIELGSASTHLSDEVGAASLINRGLTGFYTAALSAYTEAAAYLQSEGVTPAQMGGLTLRALDLLREATAEAAEKIAGGEHETDQATLTIFANEMRSICATVKSAGQPGRILSATKENLEAAEAAGLGELDLYAQAELFGAGGAVQTAT